MTLAACQAWHRGQARVCQAPRADGALDWLGCPSAPTRLGTPLPALVSLSLHQPEAGGGGLCDSGQNPSRVSLRGLNRGTESWGWATHHSQTRREKRSEAVAGFKL